MMVLIRDHSLLESFQICCQWLKSNQKIIREAGDNSAILWSRLALLLSKVNSKQYEQDLKDVKAQTNYAFPEDKIGMISHKMSLITIFGHKHKIKFI